VLHHYFIRPTTVDRIRASWIGEAIERYVIWLSEQRYASRNVLVRVPLLLRFAEYAQAQRVGKNFPLLSIRSSRPGWRAMSGSIPRTSANRQLEAFAVQSNSCFM
jgi:hypothetical protein